MDSSIARHSSLSDLMRLLARSSVWLVPFFVYLYRTFSLSSWIIDDAAISFAYARNLANGYGLVAQPGVAPVEGFSNFLWVIILTPFFRLGLFDPYVLPKILSGVLVGASFFLIHRATLSASGGNRIASFFVLLVLSLNTSFVIWTCSGLENPLLVLFVVSYMNLALTWSFRTSGHLTFSIICGVLAAGLGMTRPDGIMYAAVFPAIAVIVGSASNSGIKRIAHMVLGFIVSFGVLYATFLLFRYLYFGDFLPNTYYAKGGTTVQTLKDVLLLKNPVLHKLRELLASIFGKYGTGFLVIALGVQVTRAVLRRGRSLLQLVPLVLLAASLAAYLLLGVDWMREFRFASAFFVLVYICLFLFLFDLFDSIPAARLWRRLIPTTLSIVLALITWQVHTPRLVDFAKTPTTPFGRVVHLYGTTYDRLAAALQVPNASVLLPDLGGPLYCSSLRVYDLAGLCDRTIAKTRRKNQKAFYDYVFEEIRPTFIHTHGFFSAVSRFERDARFKRDYVAIADSLVPYFSDSVTYGEYVRRDAIAGKEDRLGELRSMLPK